MRAALDFISKDVKQYMDQNDLNFTDFETAALIYNSWLSVPEKHKRLEELAAETKEANLRKQIMEILSVEKEELMVFHENTEGFVYVLTQGSVDELCGYFATFELAHDYGLEQADAFKICKYQIVERHNEEPRKSKGYWNPYLMEENMNVEELVEEYVGDGLIAWLKYTRGGILQDFWSQEIEWSDKDDMRRIFCLDLFKNAFIHMPNPFEQGDIVRLLPNGCHGIINTSQEEWLEFLEKVAAGKFKVCDFMDASIIVECVYDKGDILHSHINPAFLEKYEPQEGDDDFKLLTTAGALLRGRGNLGFFLHCYDAYKEKIVERRDGHEDRQRTGKKHFSEIYECL